MTAVEAVIINCFRAENVLRILAAIQPQVAMTTVLDCGVEGRDWPSDRVVRFTPKKHDAGPWTRYVTSGLYEQKYTLLIDDDLLPDADMVNRFLAHTHESEILCAMGRHLTLEGGYQRGNCPPGEADIAVRCYFWKTSLLRETVPKAMSCLTLEERWYDDDIAMCLCARTKVFVIGGRVPWTELPCPHASSSNPGHIARRDGLCRRLTRDLGLIPTS